MICRRDFIKHSLLATACLLGGRSLSLAGPVTAEDHLVKSLELDIIYTTKIINPPKRKGINIWIPLPFDDHEQEIEGLSIESRVPYRIADDSWGNRMLFISVDTVAEGDRFTLKYRFKRKASGVIEDKTIDPERYRMPSEWESWDDQITGFVDSLVGDEKNPVEIGKKVYQSIIERLKYIHEVCGRGVSTLTFEDGLGRCDEYHALFRTMMMYKGIPVSWEQGILMPYPSELKEKGEFEADCINAHSWVRFYIGEGRWWPADVSEGDRRPDLRSYYFGRLVPNRIKVSTGRGLILNPPQQGIINTFAYTYIEAGGFPAIYGHNYRNVINYELLRIEK